MENVKVGKWFDVATEGLAASLAQQIREGAGADVVEDALKLVETSRIPLTGLILTLVEKTSGTQLERALSAGAKHGSTHELTSHLSRDRALTIGVSKLADWAYSKNIHEQNLAHSVGHLAQLHAKPKAVAPAATGTPNPVKHLKLL